MAEAVTTPYMQTVQEAGRHGKAFLKSTIGAHPGVSAIIMGTLLVLVIILTFLVAHYRKESFSIAPISNLTTGSNNPQWQYGSMDAGNWGPVHREANAWNIATWHPSWRAGYGSGREGFQYGPQYSALDCGPGPTSVCGTGWDPAASAEAEALATVGSFAHTGHAERRLQRAVDSAFDANLSGLSDEQLTALMHQGGTP